MNVEEQQRLEEGEHENVPSFPQLSVNVQVLVRRLVAVEPGQVITYVSLNTSVPDLNLLTNHRHTLISARRVAERDHKIVFVCERGKGLRRLTSEELADYWQQAAKRVRRIVRGTARKLACADYEKLSNEKQVQLNAGLAFCGAIELFSKPSAVRQIERGTAIAQKQLSFHETLEQFKK